MDSSCGIFFLVILHCCCNAEIVEFSDTKLLADEVLRQTKGLQNVSLPSVYTLFDSGLEVKISVRQEGLLLFMRKKTADGASLLEIKPVAAGDLVIQQKNPCDVLLFMLWKNTTHFTNNNNLNRNDKLSGRDLALDYTYSDNDAVKRGYFKVELSWDDRHHEQLGSLRRCVPSSGVMESANCLIELDQSRVRVQIPALIADRAIPLRLTFGCEKKRNVTKVVEIPANYLTCPYQAEYCNTRGCQKPGDVKEVDSQLINESVVLHWKPPLDQGDGIESYAVRYGIVRRIDFNEDQRPILFNQSLTHGMKCVWANRTNVTFDNLPIERINEPEWVVLIQVVALCDRSLTCLSGHDIYNGEGGGTKLSVERIFSPGEADDFVASYKRNTETVLYTDTSDTYTVSEVNMAAADSDASSQKDTESGIVSQVVTSVVVCGAIIVIIVGSVLYKRSINHSRLKNKRRQTVLDLMKSNPIYKSLYANMSAPDSWEIGSNRIEWGEVIGEGAFGSVYRCHLLTEDETQGSVVAVKTCNEGATEFDLHRFVQEIVVMKGLDEHAHILQMIACVTVSNPICLVMEYASNGNLLSFLHSRRPENLTSEDQVASTLTEKELVAIARDVACGMEFVASKGYIHRDLAARNILLDHNCTVKIGDFGLAKYVHSDDIYVVNKCKRLPVKWLSIEALADLVFSTASDVWAYGVLLFEIVTLGATPYPTIEPESMLSHLQSGARMAKPDICSPALYEVMLSCWHNVPANRPSFSWLLEKFQVLADLCEEGPVINAATTTAKVLPSISVDEGFDSGPTPSSRLNSESSDCSDTVMYLDETIDTKENSSDLMHTSPTESSSIIGCELPHSPNYKNVLLIQIANADSSNV